MTTMRHDLLRLAIRSQLASMTVSTTGSTTLATTATAYTRSTGSFFVDGFEPGMQLNATGFSDSGNNGLATITSVGATSMTVDKTLAVESSGAGKTLVVGSPDDVEYEEVEFAPPNNAPWLREEIVSGPRRLLSAPAVGGTIEFDPLVHLHVFVPENSGPGALDRYADAILESFKPNTALTLSDGSVARVRSDASSYRGAIQHLRPGYSSVRVTLPLRLHLINAA